MDNLELYIYTSKKLEQYLQGCKNDVAYSVNLGHSPEADDMRVYLKFLSCNKFADGVFECFERLLADERAETKDATAGINFYEQLKDPAKVADSKISAIKAQKVDAKPVLQSVIDVCLQGLDNLNDESLFEARQIINITINESNYEKSKQVRAVLKEYLASTETIAKNELARHKRRILANECENQK